MLLDAEQVTWRLAFEAAGKRCGDVFYEDLALNPAILSEWVPPGARVLDVGCGHGYFGRILADRLQSYFGIDINPNSVRIERQAPLPAHVRFEVGDARELPEMEFELVLLVHVLEHLDDPIALLRVAARLASIAIIEVPDFDRCILNPVRLDLGIDFSSDADHVREYTGELLNVQLEATGWHATARTRTPISIVVLARSD